MKKYYLFTLLLLAICSLSFAKEVPVGTAKTVGYHYLLQQGESSIANEQDLKLVYTSGKAPAYFYVFSSAHCFVMVSADDAVSPVLGYSKERAFDGAHIPSSVISFLDNYDAQINYAITNKAEPSAELAAQWSDLVQNIRATTAAKTTAVAPLLATTWNQSPYYNANCPYDAAGGGLSVSGCVATATAQVMKFWSWPNQGMGFHSYSTSAYGTLSANFAGTTYNWAAMPNNVTSANAAVATLMYHVGVSVDMSYSAASSGAYVISSASPVVNCAEYALKTYFDYKSTTYGADRSAYSDANWLNLIKGELNAGRPVIYAGYGTGGGHCFVADGFDASDFFHINWGWGGSSDGYFYMNSLNPGSLGTGGGGGGYNSGQQAIIGLEPNSVSTTLELYDYLTLSQTGIQYADTFSLNTNFYNSGATNFNGSICLAAFNASTGAFVTYIDSFSGVNLPAGFVYAAPGINLSNLYSVAMIPGTYNIKVLYRSASGGSWSTVGAGGSGAYVNSASLTVYNHNFIQTYTAMASTPSPLVQGSSASISVRLKNDDLSYNYNDSLYLGLYNLDGTGNSAINYLGATAINATAVTGTLTFNTSNITAAPGTYLLVLLFKYSGSWYICGADYAQNPVKVTVVAPAPPPDIYEVNNTAATAYDLSSTLTWSANTSAAATPGSTIHIASDKDYYKVVLPAGYNYAISARVNDVVSRDDANIYTNDVVWSYSTNGGTTWSAAYNNTMTGTINLTGLTGGTVIFYVSSANAGGTGSYRLKLGTITRSLTAGIADPRLELVQVFPNPATDVINVDMAGTGIAATSLTVSDLSGRTVYTAEANSQYAVTVPLANIPAGVYFLSVKTDAGTLNRKITVVKQ